MKALTRGVLAIAGMAALALAGCASRPQNLASSCVGEAQKPTAELVFGRASAGAPNVSQAEFRRFITREVSPRFPDGLTVVDSQGRWTPNFGSTVRQPANLVMIVLRGAPDDEAKLRAIRAAYEAQYHQPSILLPVGETCVTLS